MRLMKLPTACHVLTSISIALATSPLPAMEVIAEGIGEPVSEVYPYPGHNRTVYFTTARTRRAGNVTAGVQGRMEYPQPDHVGTIGYSNVDGEVYLVAVNNNKVVAARVGSGFSKAWELSPEEWIDSSPDVKSCGNCNLVVVQADLSRAFRGYDMRNGSLLWEIPAASYNLSTMNEKVVVSDNGSMIAVCDVKSPPAEATTMAILRPGQAVPVIQHSFAVYVTDVALNPWGSELAVRQSVGSVRTVQFYSTADLQATTHLPDQFDSLMDMKYSADGGKLGVLTANSLHVYSTATKTLIHEVDLSQYEPSAFCFSQIGDGGSWVFFGTQDGKILREKIPY